jgi:hypothetical protein
MAEALGAVGWDVLFIAVGEVVGDIQLADPEEATRLIQADADGSRL